MRKALVHDWYYVNGGAEKVIHSLNNIYGDFEHYALVDFLGEEDRRYILKGKKVNTSFIQKWPTAKKNHRKFLQFFPLAIEQFDLNSYDLVISSSASVSKGVLTNLKQLHICYCHSPMRYAWDLYHQYLEDSQLKTGLRGFYAKWVLHNIRQWDLITINRVDHFIANSKYVAQRIKKIYNRDSIVIYPPVDVNQYELKEEKQDFYLTASRMVPYKKMATIVEAFNEMPDRKLVVIGDGPDYNKINKLAKDNIELKGFLNSNELKSYMQNAKAFVFAAKEDFGIIPVEAQACGTPIIGFNEGGLKETVIDGKTGVLFDQQTPQAIKKAIEKFEKMSFNAQDIRTNAMRFSSSRFEDEMKAFIDLKYKEFKNK
jgi:glycosyltransferase involved in cell wall biosynthesis